MAEFNKEELAEKIAEGAQSTARETIRQMKGNEEAPLQLPGVAHRIEVASMSDEDSRKVDRTETAWVPKTLGLEPPEADVARPINEIVFSAPIDGPSVKSERASPVKHSETKTAKNLSLAVAIVALAFFIAM